MCVIIVLPHVHMYVSVSGWHRRLNKKAGEEEKPLYVLIPLLKCEADLVSIQAKLISEGKLRRCQRKKTRQIQGVFYVKRIS